MVLALFMALFMVGVLYYLVGIGDAVLLRERLQQSADGGVYAAAVTHARGMNIVALINMTMAVLLAILVMLRVIVFVCVIAAGILAAMSWFCWPCAAAIPPTAIIAQQADQAFKMLKEPIFQTLEILHCCAAALRVTIPAIAQAKAMYAITQENDQIADVGLVFPVFEPLPIEDDSSGELCGRAGEYAGTFLADVTIGSFLPPVKKIMAGAVGGLARGLAPFFCGTGGGQPPKATFGSPVDDHPNNTRAFPAAKSPAIDECLASTNPKTAKRQGSNHPASLGDACQQASEDQRQAFEYDSRGECQYESCTERIQQAADVCMPRMGVKFVGYAWQERAVTVTLMRVGQQQIEKSREVGESRLRRDARPPCGGDKAIYGHGWNAQDEDQPLCVEEQAFSEARRNGQSTFSYTEVVKVLHCEQEVDSTYTMPVEAADPPPAQPRQVAGTTCSAGPQSRVPHKVIDGTRFGDDRLQLRAIALRRHIDNAAEKLVRIGTKHAERPEGQRFGDLASRLQHLEKFQVAQAEYFFDGVDQDPGEWLWHMHWRARFRRIRWKQEAGGTLDSLPLSVVAELSGLFAH